MLKIRLIRAICFLCVIVCAISLVGCSEKTSDMIPKTYSDVSGIDDFKCVCSDFETKFVIENDKAKSLYTYIIRQWQKAEETQFDRTEQDCIYLSFQDTETVLFPDEDSTETTTIMTLEDTKDAIVADVEYYGDFYIYENDYMVCSATPQTSAQLYFKIPKGTYNKVAEMISNE